ncbi:hypothetical protein [Rheinheimera sp. MMS21-TC3]|uniref:hypothetical protein n=1 Tax=Rheinheimera sp. MMS21-TC3 TaxID=3072790 RepID=UPI0028C46549|nr:hypothetical protein [Rheinheimera sp. MMS21-TC3]WNO60001.1 hypothetical protein RDV63_03330 [Rheinheimera sp. MMS21-TC3]
MGTSRGMVLVIALIVLLSMTLVMTASLYVSQLSQKSATAGQQQLQVSQQALTEHNVALDTALALTDDDLVACPAKYAAWSDTALRCKAIFLSTQTYSSAQHFYSGYTSLLLRQALAEEVITDDLE